MPKALKRDWLLNLHWKIQIFENVCSYSWIKIELIVGQFYILDYLAENCMYNRKLSYLHIMWFFTLPITRGYSTTWICTLINKHLLRAGIINLAGYWFEGVLNLREALINTSFIWWPEFVIHRLLMFLLRVKIIIFLLHRAIFWQHFQRRK